MLGSQNCGRNAASLTDESAFANRNILDCRLQIFFIDKKGNNRNRIQNHRNLTYSSIHFPGFVVIL